MLRFTRHILIISLLTMLTQIGGIAWFLSRLARKKIMVFLLLYISLSLGANVLAPSFGRVALNCFSDGPLMVQNWAYCALNRNYVTPDLKRLLEDTASQMETQFPGTKTLVLDASFPFLNGFPLLPHLSHNDGEKADLAFYYRDKTGYLPAKTRSPIGYFAFEEGPTNCTAQWADLRWDLGPLQPLWKRYTFDPVRNKALLEILARDPRIGKIFVEPHLVQNLAVQSKNIRFQGCRAARHDDHIHLQLK